MMKIITYTGKNVTCHSVVIGNLRIAVTFTKNRPSLFMYRRDDVYVFAVRVWRLFVGVHHK